MGHIAGVDRVSLRFGTRALFQGLVLGIDDGDRIGVVGPNGAGKSTLLRLIDGQQIPDQGRVTRAGGTTVGLLDQRDLAAPGQTVLDVVHGDLPEHQWAGSSAIRDIHDGLLADLDWAQPVDTLSGGQRRRVALAALLARDPDLLLLDEPTNHLDVEGVAWLADHLRRRYGGGASNSAGGGAANGALVVVTHDRWFLDAVCSRMWEVVPNPRTPATGVEQYEGGYAAYILARAERARQSATANEKRNNLLRKELAWLRRGAPARTSKPKFRLDAASELIADEPPPRDQLELTKLATRRLGKDVLDLEDASLSFGSNTILDRQTWRLGPGDRFGVVGVNGAGKTTLLALLADRIQPDSGRVKRGKTVAVAELSQSAAELDALAGLTAVQVIERERANITVARDTPGFMARTSSGAGKVAELTAAQLTERLGFTRERAHTRVAELSGGERRRLQLARLLVGQPNVLLLDEPTNDLDTDTLAAVEDLLDTWQGTLVVVSHDRYLLERVTDRQFAMYGDGAILDLPGGVEQYLLERRRRRDSGRLSPSKPPAAASEPGGLSQPGRLNSPEPPLAPAATAEQRRQARKDLARIERQLAKLDGAEARWHQAITDNPTDAAVVVDATAKLTALAAERDALEADWLAAADLA